MGSGRNIRVACGQRRRFRPIQPRPLDRQLLSSGQIDAYNFTSGQFDGKLHNSDGTPLVIPGLRTIHFGPGLGISGQKTPKDAALLFTEDPFNGNNVSALRRDHAFQLSPRDPFVSRTGFADLSVLRQIARAGGSPAVVRTALRRPETRPGRISRSHRVPGRSGDTLRKCFSRH